LNAVLVVFVEAALECGQLVGADDKATVVDDPVGQRDGADVAQLVLVHLVEDVLAIDLAAFLHLLDLVFRQDHGLEEFRQGVHDGLLYHVFLLE